MTGLYTNTHRNKPNDGLMLLVCLLKIDYTSKADDQSYLFRIHFSRTLILIFSLKKMFIEI